MAERAEPAVPGAPTGGPAAPPKIAPWLVVYTVGRLAIAAALQGTGLLTLATGVLLGAGLTLSG